MTRRTSTAAAGKTTKAIVTEEKPVANGNGKAPGTNGHLAPPQPATPLGWSWRDFSRSPSPLGLIPIHRHWRTFVHKHEVPRKVLHVSIGFFVIWLYVNGTQPRAVTPWLMSALIPIAGTDWLRHRYASFNRFYVKVLGALMRESEYSGWNGVIWYLLGAWIVLYGFPKDVGIMSVLLLSWCDTAASTFGRLWGRYTPRLRRGKSLAGSTAAFLVGVGTSYFFYNWLVPTFGPYPGDEGFLFTGTLSLPKAITEAVGLSKEQATITGSLALGVMGLWSGFVASASEVVDIFGWDDNLTIPVLSGIGIWGFLKVFS
jgi:diacylglycerol kinase (CTP)